MEGWRENKAGRDRSIGGKIELEVERKRRVESIVRVGNGSLGYNMFLFFSIILFIYLFIFIFYLFFYLFIYLFIFFLWKVVEGRVC